MFVFAFKIKVLISLKIIQRLYVNEAKLTSLWARNCASIQQVLIFKFVFGPEKFPGLSRNEPRVVILIRV